MNLDTNFLSNINRSFKALNTLVECVAADSIVTTMLGQDLIDAISGNFAKSATEAPASVTSLTIGMTGTQVLAAINNSFTAKGQSVYSTKPVVSAMISNIDKILGWYDAYDLTTITKDESETVTKWGDILGSDHDLNGSCTWDVNKGMTFNGTDEYLKSDVNIIDGDKLSVYIFFRQLGSTVDRVIFSGLNPAFKKLFQQANDITRIADNVCFGAPRKMWSTTRIVYDGANSRFSYNDDKNGGLFDGLESTFDSLGVLPSGICFGAQSDGINQSNFSNIEIQAILLINEALTLEDEEGIQDYLKKEYMSKYRFVNGKVVFTWDGDYINDYIYPGHLVLQEYGVKDLVYLCTVGGGGSADMWDNLAIMGVNGCEMASHGTNHDMMHEMTEAQLEEDFLTMSTNIQAHGFPAPKHFVPPYAYTSSLLETVARRTLLTQAGAMNATFHVYGTKINKFQIPRYGLGGTTNSGEGLQKVKDAITYAVNNKCIVIFYCHGMDEISGGTNEAGLRALCQHIVDSGIEKCNMSDIEPLLSED